VVGGRGGSSDFLKSILPYLRRKVS